MPILSNQPQQTENQQPVGRRERGTGFTNIGRLLGANVGAGEQMGQTIGSTIGGKAGQLKADVSKAGSEFQKRFGESVGQAQDVFGKASGLIPSSPTGISSGLSGMKEEEAKELGAKLSEAKTYRGPTALEGQEQIGARAKSVAGMGELAKAGSAGQGLLMQNIAGKAKPYTRGQSALDTLLMGQSKEAQKAIREGAGQTYGAEQTAQTAITGAEQQAKEASRSLGKQYSDILKQASESGESISKAGTEQAADFLKGAERIKNLFSQGFNPKELSEEDKNLILNLDKYGIDTKQALNLQYSPYSRPIDKYYTRFPGRSENEVLNDLLKQIAATGDVVLQESQKYYTPEQKSAARNLALLKQEAPVEIEDFNTKRFGGSQQELEKYAAAQEAKTGLENKISDTQYELARDLYWNIKNLEGDPGTQSGGIKMSKDIVGSPEERLARLKYLVSQPNLTQWDQGWQGEWVRRPADLNRLQRIIKRAEETLANVDVMKTKSPTLQDYLKGLAGQSSITNVGSGRWGAWGAMNLSPEDQARWFDLQTQTDKNDLKKLYDLYTTNPTYSQYPGAKDLTDWLKKNLNL